MSTELYELDNIGTNLNNGAEYSSHQRVAAGNGDGAANWNPEPTERDAFLQSAGTNGGHAAEGQRNQGNEFIPQERSCLCRIKDELKENVFCGVKLWMVIIFIFLLIIVVITVSLVVCSVITEDVDETFDRSLFNVPHYFNGSFEMPNKVFTEELLTLSSNESQALTADLREKLADLYRSSPALGRFFSEAEIYAFRNGSVIADYKLTFILPEEQQDQLRNFTLSREMVFNVFRQFLYDQEQVELESKYIDPVSLTMFSRH